MTRAAHIFRARPDGSGVEPVMTGGMDNPVDVVFTPGGVPAKIDPNGKYQVEQMYVQYFLPQARKGKVPLLLWHGGGLTGVTYETKPDGDEGWLAYFIRKGWDTYISDAVERGRRLDQYFQRRSSIPAVGRSLGTLSHWSAWFVERRQSQTHDLSRRPVPGRGVRAVHEAGGAALAHHRQSDHHRLH